MADEAQEYSATGRRKTAVARVRIQTGEGKCTVNKREFDEYFPASALRAYVLQPLEYLDAIGKYDIAVSVNGGGPTGQAGAMRHGLARALTIADDSSKDTLKSRGCLTRDPRMKERKKSGQPGARKRFQFSKR